MSSAESLTCSSTRAAVTRRPLGARPRDLRSRGASTMALQAKNAAPGGQPILEPPTAAITLRRDASKW